MTSPVLAKNSAQVPSIWRWTPILWLGAHLCAFVPPIWRFTTDDAYISTRYAANLAKGKGLVWNPGEIVEGYSNFLWVLLQAAAMTVGMNALLVMKILSVISVFGVGLLVFSIARSWLDPISAIAPMIVTLSYVGILWWSVSGLETAFFQLLSLAATLLVFRGLGFRESLGGSEQETGAESRAEVDPRALAIGGVVAALAGLTRFEGPVVALALMAAIGVDPFLSSRGNIRTNASLLKPAATNLLRFGVPFSLIYLPYFAFRFLTFGHMVPNSVACKEVLHWGGGNLLEGAVVFLPLGLLAILAVWSRFDARTLALLLVCIAYIVVLWRADPVLGYKNRYFLPALGPLTILASVGLFTGRKYSPKAVVLTLMAISAVVSAWYSRSLHAEARGYQDRQALRSSVAEWANETVGPEASVAMGDVGLFGTVFEGRIVDLLCLNHPDYALPPLNGNVALVAEDIMQESPDLVVLSDFDGYGAYDAIRNNQRFRVEYEEAKEFPSFGKDFVDYQTYRKRN